MPDLPNIAIIVGSTREQRAGIRVARWFMDIAAQRQDLHPELIDLKEWDFPMFSDANLPSTGVYTTEITKRWSATVAACDGFVIVTPEYNHGYPAALKNALDYLYREWNRKPVAFVSYGSSAGGARSVEQLKQVVLDLQLVPIRPAVLIPFIRSAFDEHGVMVQKGQDTTAQTLLDQLVWWAGLLREARASRPFPQPRPQP